MPSLGEKLRSERETRGIPLDEIAAETRISLRFLDALEKGDLEHLPGGAFNKGFVRTYAKFLGLEPEPFVREYEEEEHTATEIGRLPERRDVLDEMRETLGRSEPAFGDEAVRRVLRVVVPFVIVAALAALTWWVVLPIAGEWTAQRAAQQGAADSGLLGDAPGAADSGLPGGATATEAGGSGEAPTIAGGAPESDPAVGTGKVAAAGAVTSTAPTGETPTDDLASGDAPAGDAAREDDASPRESAMLGTKPATEDDVTRGEAADANEEPAPVASTRNDASRESETARAEPAAIEAPASPEPSPAVAGLVVTDWGVGMGVENRELVGRGTVFENGDSIFFWTRVEGGSPGKGIRHVWLRDGRPVGLVKLPVNGSHWRTHSRFTLPYNAHTSRWSVEARDSGGRVLASQEFSVDG